MPIDVLTLPMKQEFTIIFLCFSTRLIRLLTLAFYDLYGSFI